MVVCLSFGLPKYRSHKSLVFVFFGFLLSVVIILLLLSVTEVAFQRLGFTRLEVVLILIGTFLGSSVNIPFHRITTVNRMLKQEEVRFFWITYRIPHFSVEEVSTIVAVNLGGAIIPTVVSLYLIRTHEQQIPPALLVVTMTALVVHVVARKVPGLGNDSSFHPATHSRTSGVPTRSRRTEPSGLRGRYTRNVDRSRSF